MAETKVVTLDLQTNIDQAEKSVGSLKSQLREAKKEVLAMSDQFGVTSEQAIKAAEKAGELGHQISEANKLVKSFNPSNSLQSTTSALGGVKEGFEVVGNTMKVIGVQSEGLQTAISKVGIAMELSQGISAVQESASAFKTFATFVQSFTLVQKISTAAQWLWNIAMDANPIGAIVVVVTALIAAGYKLVQMFQESSAAAELNAKSNAALSNEISNLEKASKKANVESELSRTKQLGLAKANGESAESIRKLTLEIAKQEEAEKLLNVQRARRLFFSAQSRLADDQDDEAAKENVKKAKEQYKKMFDEHNESILNIKKIRVQNQIDEAQERTDANKKEQEDAKKHHDDLLEKQKEANKKAEEEKKKQKEKEDKELEDKKKAEQEIYDAAQKALKERNDAELKSLDDIDAAKKANEDRGKTEQQLALEAENATYQLKLDNANKFGQDTTELTLQHTNNITDINKKASESNIKLAEAEAAAKMAQMGAVANALDGLAKIAGEKTAAGKALAIAAATINTYKGISEVWGAASMGNPIVDMAVKIASTAIVAVQGIANVKKIMAVQIPGGGGGGGSAPTAGATPAAPSFNVVGNSGVNQIAGVMQQQGAAPVQAYVVANNVTTAQSLGRNIISNATLG